MSIAIRTYTGVKEGERAKDVAWIAEDDWELPSLFLKLEEWIQESGSSLPVGDYVVDIGFSPRPDALGGGGVLGIETMKVMAKKGMELHISEYPVVAD